MEEVDLRETEQLLKQFRFRPPKPDLVLSSARVHRRRSGVWGTVVLSAALLIASSALVLYDHSAQKISLSGHRTLNVSVPQVSRILTAGDLNQALRIEPGALDEVLLRISPQLLPDVERSQGVLHALSRE